MGRGGGCHWSDLQFRRKHTYKQTNKQTNKPRLSCVSYLKGVAKGFADLENMLVEVAFSRFVARLDSFADVGVDTDSSVQQGWELDNIQIHVLPGGRSFAQELIHVSPIVSGVSGVYCLAAPDPQDSTATAADGAGGDGGGGGSNVKLVLMDPRGRLANVSPLPVHTGSVGGGDGNPYYWDVTAGGLILFPGDVPRRVLPNAMEDEVVYLSFDFKPKSTSARATDHSGGDNCNGGVDNGSADCSPANSVGYTHELVSYNENGFVATVRPYPGVGEKAAVQPDMATMYSLHHRMDENSAVLLEDVEDTVRWGTPIGLMHPAIPSGLTDRLVADAVKLVDRFREEQRDSNVGGAFFQPPNLFNVWPACGVQNESCQQQQQQQHSYTAVDALKPLITAAILAYTSATPDCSTLEGGGSALASCRKQVMQWQEWALRASVGSYTITSSWVNVAGKVEDTSITDHIAHVHSMYHTAVTGIYYASSGVSPAQSSSTATATSTAVHLVRPATLNSKIGPSMLTINPKAGTLLLFPSYLRRAGDIHLGDEQPVSFTFNAAENSVISV